MLEVSVSRHDVNDPQFAHDDHARDVRKGNVWFVGELEPKFKSGREAVRADEFYSYPR